MNEQIVRDIAQNKIRGDENIARWGLLAFFHKKKELDEKCSFISTYMINLQKEKKLILESTDNIVLHKILDKIFDKKLFQKAQELDDVKKTLDESIKKYEIGLERMILRISSIGAHKIKKGYTVVVFGMNTYSEMILEEAAKQVKFNLLVLKDEENISIKGVKKKTFTLYELPEIMDYADLVFINSYAIDANKVYCKKGSHLFCSCAENKKVPVYTCLNRFSSGKINCSEEREIISATLLRGIISDLGIHTPREFLRLL